jgi:hypothetical protein
MKDFKPVLMTAIGVAIGLIIVNVVSKRIPALSSFESDYEGYEGYEMESQG